MIMTYAAGTDTVGTELLGGKHRLTPEELEEQLHRIAIRTASTSSRATGTGVVPNCLDRCPLCGHSDPVVYRNCYGYWLECPGKHDDGTLCGLSIATEFYPFATFREVEQSWQRFR